jgi:hypothetical protein
MKLLDRIARAVLQELSPSRSSVLITELPNNEYGMILGPPAYADLQELWIGKRDGAYLRFEREGEDDIVVAWPYTIAEAKAELRALGLTMRVEEGEFIVNKRGGREATAHYTDDLTDAVATGVAMAAKGAW